MEKEALTRKISDISFKKGKFIVVEQKKLLNLSSNDYLNLSSDSSLVEEFIEKYKSSPEFYFSSASARLLTGNSKSYIELEAFLSKLFKKERALLFNTGFQCNLGVVSTLYGKGDVIFSDKLNHASIIDGLKMSNADFFRYKHLDYEHLENFLKSKRDNYKNALIISESVFSMDGDIADIDKLIELKKKYNAKLFIDEAHSFGIFGDNLTGISNYKDVDIITATFGKAIGSVGAFCVSDDDTIETLINRARPFIFSTSLAPVNILWTNFILNEKFDLLRQKSAKLLKLCKNLNSNTQILPVIVGDSEKCLKISEVLKSRGYFVLPIRPPTVPLNTSRFRLSLCSDIEKDEVLDVLTIIKELL